PAGSLSLAGTIRTARDWSYLSGALDPGLSTLVFAGSLTMTNPVPLYRVDVRIGTVTLGAPLHLLDRLTVTSGTLDSSGYDITVAGTVSVVGTLDLTGVTLTAGSDTTLTGTVITAGSTIMLVGPGAQTLVPGASALNDLTVDNVTGVALGGDTTVSGTLDLVNGTLAIGAHSLSIAQPLTGTPTNLVGGPTSSLIIIGGSASGIRVPSSISELLDLDSTNAQGVALDADLLIDGTLALDGGNLVADPFLVTIAPTGAVTRTGGHVVGRLQKPIPAGGALVVTFEVGDLAAYAPVDVVWSAVSLGGTLTVATWPGDDPGLAAAGLDPAASLNRSWTLAPIGLASNPAELTLNFQPADLDAVADPSALVAAFGDGTGWVLPTVLARTAASLTVVWAAGVDITVVAGMAAADLAIGITGPTTMPSGGSGSYAIDITNAGPMAADALTATIPILAGATLGPATPTQGSCLLAGGILTCDLGPLAPGASAGVTIQLTFGAPGDYDLQAAVSLSGASDPDVADNVARLTVSVVAQPQPTPTPTPSPSSTQTPAPSSTIPAPSPSGGGLPDTNFGGQIAGLDGGPFALAVILALCAALLIAAHPRTIIRLVTALRHRP
ncbi:MAG: hypothetical protein ACRDGJ_09500, partial [Candidatus Limnocylindria bacterium]